MNKNINKRSFVKSLLGLPFIGGIVGLFCSDTKLNATNVLANPVKHFYPQYMQYLFDIKKMLMDCKNCGYNRDFKANVSKYLNGYKEKNIIQFYAFIDFNVLINFKNSNILVWFDINLDDYAEVAIILDIVDTTDSQYITVSI
jgi:hypothetical protein